VYDSCESLAGAAAGKLLAALKAITPVRVNPHLDNAEGLQGALALAGAGYDEHLAET
jgi:hypothetical protein